MVSPSAPIPCPGPTMRLLPFVMLACVPPRNPGSVPVEGAAAPARVLTLPGDGPLAVVVVHAGAASDPIGKEGVAWWVAHALVASAEPPIDVVVDEDLTTFTLRCAPDGPDCGAQLGARVATAPSEDALERARASRVSSAASPEGPAGAALQSLIFTGHPYGHPPSGRDGSFPAITAVDAAAFHAAAYVRVSVAGGVAGGPTAGLSAALA